MSNRTYIVVFHGERQEQKIFDIGDDPCFDNLPTWGICRPNYRRSIKPGDTLFFLAKIRSDYFLKGWFQVGEKIDYLKAMRRFPKRKNVMLSSKKAKRQNRWRYGNLKKKYAEKHGNQNPIFLIDLKCTEGTFYQNPLDNHEIDNWKCRRIFHCQSRQFEHCINANSCLKNGETLCNYKNYIVADKNNWDNVESLNVTLDDIRNSTGFNKPIRTPLNQHNVQRFDDFKQKLLNYLKKRKTAADNKSKKQ